MLTPSFLGDLPELVPGVVQNITAARLHDCDNSARGTDKRQHTLNILKLLLDEYKGRVASYMHGENGDFLDENAMPVNVIREAVDAALAALVPGKIETSFKPQTLQDNGVARMKKVRMDAFLTRAKAHRVFEKAVICALCAGSGYVRCGPILAEDEAQGIGDTRQAGELYIRHVLNEDIVCDPNADAWEDQSFRRVRVLMPRATAERLYPGADLPSFFDTGGQEEGHVRTYDSANQTCDLLDFVAIREWYTNFEGKTYWCVTPDDEAAPIMLQEWRPWQQGFEGGPVEQLTFVDLPGMVDGIAPIAQIYDLHKATGKVATKLVNKVLYSKSGLVHDPASKTLAQNISHAADGFILEGKPNGVQELNIVGPGVADFQSYEFLRQQSDTQIATNAMRAGREGATKLATVASITNANTQMMLARMRSRVREFMVAVVTKLSKWQDLLDEAGLSPETETYLQDIAGEKIELVLSERTREKATLELLIDVEIDDSVPMDPATRGQLFLQTVQMTAGLIPMLAQMQIPPLPLIEAVAREMRMPAIADVFQSLSAQQADQFLMMMAQQGQMQPNITMQPKGMTSLPKQPGQGGPVSQQQPAQYRSANAPAFAQGA